MDDEARKSKVEAAKAQVSHIRKTVVSARGLAGVL
jgi:hypothetical protein